MDEELSELQGMLSDLLSNTDSLGGERVQPYICILEGVLKGINIDLNLTLK